MPTSSRIVLGIALISSVVSIYLWSGLRSAGEIVAQDSASNRVQMPRSHQGIEVAEIPGVHEPMPENDAESGLAGVQIDQTESTQGPAYSNARREQLRPSIMRRYPDLAMELGLSPAAAKVVFDVLIDLDIFARENVNRPPGEATVTRSQFQEVQKEADRKLVALIGSDKSRQWEFYRDTLASRMRMQQVQEVVTLSGYQPLDDVQQKAVITTFHDAEARKLGELSRLTAPASSDARDRIAAETARWIIDTLSPHLSSEQLSVVKQNLDQRLNPGISGRRVVQSRKTPEK